MEDKKIDENEFDIPLKEIKSKKAVKAVRESAKDPEEYTPQETVVNCLRNERITVRHIPKEGGFITNPKHLLYGGMAENALKFFTVPILSSGVYVNILTDAEKACLEEKMGLEYNALSIYKKENNYWDNFMVRLTKQDNILDLSNPDDYIRYKVLLANKLYIAPSLEVLQDFPKATYQYVIMSEGEDMKNARDNMSITMKCYKEFGKVESDVETLRTIIELIDGRPTSKDAKLEFLQTRINNLIQTDSKMFLKVITDPLLSTKVLIKRCIESGLISNRGDYLYLRSDNTPLCDHNEEPTLAVAARYLNMPKHQSIKFSLEGSLNSI